jgi:hypothetical protein
VRSLKTSMAKYKRQTDNDLNNTTEKTKDLTRGIHQQSEIKCSEWVRRSCFTYDRIYIFGKKLP